MLKNERLSTSLIFGALNVLVTVFLVYFIFRYTVSLLVLDSNPRAILLGPALRDWVPNNEEFIKFVGSFLIASKITYLFMVLPRWKRGMQKLEVKENSKKIQSHGVG